jgi:hypothetical protein
VAAPCSRGAGCQDEGGACQHRDVKVGLGEGQARRCASSGEGAVVCGSRAQRPEKQQSKSMAAN